MKEERFQEVYNYIAQRFDYYRDNVLAQIQAAKEKGDYKVLVEYMDLEGDCLDCPLYTKVCSTNRDIDCHRTVCNYLEIEDEREQV